MARRKKVFAPGEYYHIYNRGVEKRKIFRDRYDVDRFFRSMVAFNTVEPTGSLRHVYIKQKNRGQTPVCEIIGENGLNKRFYDDL